MLTRDALQLLAEKLPASDADLNVRPRANANVSGVETESSSFSSSQYLWAHTLSQETVAAVLAAIFAFVELPRAQLETQLQRSHSRQSKRGQPTKASTAAIRCVHGSYTLRGTLHMQVIHYLELYISDFT